MWEEPPASENMKSPGPAWKRRKAEPFLQGLSVYLHSQGTKTHARSTTLLLTQVQVT